eukprot:3231898-Rhodomonas_salina.1
MPRTPQASRMRKPKAEARGPWMQVARAASGTRPWRAEGGQGVSLTRRSEGGEHAKESARQARPAARGTAKGREMKRGTRLRLTAARSVGGGNVTCWDLKEAAGGQSVAEREEAVESTAADDGREVSGEQVSLLEEAEAQRHDHSRSPDKEPIPDARPAEHSTGACAIGSERVERADAAEESKEDHASASQRGGRDDGGEEELQRCWQPIAHLQCRCAEDHDEHNVYRCSPARHRRRCTHAHHPTGHRDPLGSS